MTASPVLTSDPAADIDRYRRVRARMPRLAEGVSPEDLSAQSMTDASPGKWHLAHTSWFFEAVILARDPDYRPVDERLQRIFNSYYEALGTRVDRGQRGLMTRPSLDEVLAYRAEIDRRMVARLERGLDDGLERYLFDLGLAHDEQHQELFQTDLLHLLSLNPLAPAAYGEEPGRRRPEARRGVARLEGGIVEIGAGDDGFAFDNEGPRHRVLLEPFVIDRDLVTNRQWLSFVMDGGYGRAELWLSDGWATVQTEGWRAPLHWRECDGGWVEFTLAGERPLDPDAPVRHISFYEADAFARWAGRRLPTEAEWEVAAVSGELGGLYDQVWQWTASPYVAYPGFQPTPGTAAEYNGKFMANQMVVRGGSQATAPGHARATYRSFFYPHQRWQFTGLRLAGEPATSPQGRRTGFAEALVEGLSRNPKRVEPKWFYDAEGSDLFERITDLPEYYPTRQERALLAKAATRLAAAMGPGAVLVEFGSGASEKTRELLDAAPDLAAYVAIDISPDAVEAAAKRLRRDYPGLAVVSVVGDFMDLKPLPAALPAGRRVGFFPGSTIGNLSPEDQTRFLKSARALLGADALFILGVDLVKDEGTLVAAYDDAAGVTAAFNLNLLARANRELGAAFDLDAFDHRAVWNADEESMEMHLVSRRDQIVVVDGVRIAFRAGETIHTESSRKFTQASLRRLAEAGGWRLDEVLVSSEPSVALALLR